jgi:GT2 family glycosyltransferase
MKKQIVVIPVHNQLPFFVKALESVITHSPDAVIIVVDDGSTDLETSRYLERNSDSYIFLKNNVAKGFSSACNKGIQYAIDVFDFHCICLLNSDAEVVTEDWFTKVEKYFIQMKDTGVASVMSDNAMAQTIKDVPNYLRRIHRKPFMYSPLAHGFCYFISKRLIEKIGLLDEIAFPHYGSEDDYSLKSIKNGFKNMIIGSVFVKHNNETSYTHDVREEYVKISLPALLDKWGKKYVDDCVRRYVDVCKKINRW